MPYLLKTTFDCPNEINKHGLNYKGHIKVSGSSSKILIYQIFI